MRRTAPLLVPAVLVAVLIACTTSASPDGTTAPSPAASQSMAAPSTGTRPSTEPQVSPIPKSEPSLAPPTLAPDTALAELLPDYVGPTPLDDEATTIAELTANGDQIAIGRLLSALNLQADDLEVAAAYSGEIALVAARADGLSGEELAAAYVKVAVEALPDTSLTDVEVDPFVLQRVSMEVDDEVASLTVLPFDDAIVIAAAEPDQHDLVELTLWRMLHPGPERFLPAELDGRPLPVLSMPGEAFPTGGDVCAIVCPGEVQAMARELGIEVTDMRIAFGLLEESPQLAIIAFEAPGAADEDLMDIRGKLGRHDATAERLTVDGKEVRRYVDTVAGTPTTEQWEYSADGVLYVVFVEPAGESVRPLVDEAIAALP